MPGITKQRYEEIQEAAMQVVASYTVQRFDDVQKQNNTAWNAINRGFAYQLVAEFGITFQTARQHIAKACRRQRNPNWIAPEWGGKREGAGSGGVRPGAGRPLPGNGRLPKAPGSRAL